MDYKHALYLLLWLVMHSSVMAQEELSSMLLRQKSNITNTDLIGSMGFSSEDLGTFRTPLYKDYLSAKTARRSYQTEKFYPLKHHIEVRKPYKDPPKELMQVTRDLVMDLPNMRLTKSSVDYKEHLAPTVQITF